MYSTYTCGYVSVCVSGNPQEAIMLAGFTHRHSRPVYSCNTKTTTETSVAVVSGMTFVPRPSHLYPSFPVNRLRFSMRVSTETISRQLLREVQSVFPKPTANLSRSSSFAVRLRPASQYKHTSVLGRLFFALWFSRVNCCPVRAHPSNPNHPLAYNRSQPCFGLVPSLSA